ncbi:hypothetical protein [Azospirillum endophyticum]
MTRSGADVGALSKNRIPQSIGYRTDSDHENREETWTNFRYRS